MKSGTMTTDDGTVFFPRLTEAQFLNTNGGLKSQMVISRGPYKRYKLPLTSIAGRRFAISVLFYGGVIAEVSLSHPVGRSWSDYDQTAEENASKENEVWLSTRYGISIPADFAWGSIYSGMDLKGGFNFLTLRYQQASKKTLPG